MSKLNLWGEAVNTMQNLYSFLVKKRILFILSLVAFVLLSFGKILGHIHWYDEIISYNIAHDLNLIEIFRLMKYEGHLFLWYLLLMPFAKINFSAAFSLGFISFSCIFISILLIWKYAPFNDFEKFLISISSHMVFYSVYSRCYCLSILFLVLIFCLYPKRLKHPYLYSLLLILSANTSSLALFAATMMGLLFLYDMYKGYKDKILSKKNISLMLAMFIIAGMLILYQLLNFDTSSKDITWIQDTDLIRNFLDAMFYADFSIYYAAQLSYLLVFALFPLLCIKNFKPLFFTYGSSFLFFALFMFVYPPQAWHLSFLFVYLILGFWFVKLENKGDTISKNVVSSFFVLYLWINTLVPLTMIPGVHNEVSKYILQYGAKYENSKVYFFHAASYLQEIMPAVYKTKMTIQDAVGYPINSFEHYKNQAYLPYTALDYDEIFVNNKDKDTYIFVDSTEMLLLSAAFKKTGKWAALDKVDEVGPTYIFKVVKQR